MRVTPRTEAQLQTINLLPQGIYDFMVVGVSDKPSKAGNEMITLTLKVWDETGKEHEIKDYLLDALAYKVRHFAEATGLLDKYNAGNIDHNDCMGKTGRVEIIIQEGQLKDDGSRHANRNSVKDYILSKDKALSKPKEITESDLDDSIPF
jgi:hypothetical protein